MRVTMACFTCCSAIGGALHSGWSANPHWLSGVHQMQPHGLMIRKCPGPAHIHLRNQVSRSAEEYHRSRQASCCGCEARRVNAFIVQVYSAGFPFRNDGRVRTASGWTLVVRMQLACDLVVIPIGVV
jgi:hypothetical protein